jgi:ATP-dependent DNA helicase RecG
VESRRGRSLAYLTTVDVAAVRTLAGKRARDLAKADIHTVTDLLLHTPRRYLDRSKVISLDAVPLGEEVTVIGRVEKVSTRRPRRNLSIVDATVYDGTNLLNCVWFNQPFRARQLSAGQEVALSGKIERYRGKLQMSSPAVDVLDRPGESLVTGRVVPIHPSTGGVAPGHLRRAIHNALQRSRPVTEVLPADLVDRLGLVSRDRALANIHFPETLADADRARERLVFDELLRLEVALAMRKHRHERDAVGIEHDAGPGVVDRFLESLPFTPTGDQVRVIEEIRHDLAATYPMHRLLLGDVGTGKTLVAVAGLLVAVQGGHQGAVMAPTGILAEQHYLGITDLIAAAGMAPATEHPDGPTLFDSGAGETPVRAVTIALLTSDVAEVNFRPAGATSRDEVLEWVADGTIDLVVGTHALIQEGVHFSRLGVAVVDEQHRFGVYQRVQLREKGAGADPDLLIMTATPIPRTLSMTLYGDLEVSRLTEYPPRSDPETGRRYTPEELEVETVAVPKSPAGWDRVYERIRGEVERGNQAFVVCPLVEDSDKLYAASATAEFERLQGVFSDLRLGLIHGQMRPAEKAATMAAMRSEEIDILVATTVIEVGIDIPGSTVMVIEDADRFGLSQLHQLRGRLSRGRVPNYCYLIAEPTTAEGEQRLAAMVSTTDGFRLAEEDLRIRGQGTVFGARQAGLTDLKLADILEDFEILTTARREAFALVAADPELTDHPGIREEIRSLLGEDVEWLFVS